ncbi:deoxyhypusine synthase [Candidatus Woesearchaeota archaeon]|nr:deoxyhypusine synthase [Candidatus Woesearchaeota archaeon]
MKKVSDLRWKKGISVNELVEKMGKIGFQSAEMQRAVEVILKMRKENAKIFFTYTSNMVTSGLRGFFAQLIELGLVDIIVTTIGGIEEDIMKSKGEEFIIGKFKPDDIELHEKGINRVGNLFIRNESYLKFEDEIGKILLNLYNKKPRWTPSELIHEIGCKIEDKNSILYQASKKNVPIFCPGITDGAFGFHLFMLQQKYPDFVIDVVKDFSNILFSTSHDDKKGLLSLGGSISKHHAILACLLNGGLDYAVYLTTAHSSSGSMSGATTEEAKSWGKVKDDSDVATVIGDVTFTFPLIMIKVLETLSDEGLLE